MDPLVSTLTKWIVAFLIIFLLLMVLLFTFLAKKPSPPASAPPYPRWR